MRQIRRNKQKIKYALLIGEADEIKLDKDGNPIVAYVDYEGVTHYVETGKKVLEYSVPVEYRASISFSGSDIELTPYGINTSDYDAIIVANRGELPITETSLVWYDSEVKYKDANHTIVDSKSADYTVVKITPSLNTVRYQLKKIVK